MNSVSILEDFKNKMFLTTQKNSVRMGIVLPLPPNCLASFNERLRLIPKLGSLGKVAPAAQLLNTESSSNERTGMHELSW